MEPMNQLCRFERKLNVVKVGKRKGKNTQQRRERRRRLE
jgi:hypothetical protein